jgi:hypothetical protein
MHGGVELHGDGGDRILEGRQLGPRLRRAAHVIQNEPRVDLHHGAHQIGVGGQPGGIVDDIGAQLQRLRSDTGFVRVHGKRNRKPPLQALEDGDEPAQFLGFGNAHGAGARGFGSDVDDVGAFFFQLQGAGEGAVGVAVLTAIRERVGGDVENSHDERALAELQGLVSEFPFVVLTGHEGSF